MEQKISNEQAIKTEALRKRLLDTIYAGAFSGLPAMILDESTILKADYATLVRIAREYGI